MVETVRINLKPLERFSREVRRNLQSNAPGPVRDAVRQWGARYRSFAKLRFDRFSKGGGNWPSLAASTMKRRRKARRGFKGATRQFSILRDTGLLFKALMPEFTRRPGQWQLDIPFGLEVGYGGPGRYPDGKATVADVASFHQKGFRKGKRHLPKRETIVPPDAKTINRMAQDMAKGLQLLGQKCGGGGTGL